MEPQRESDRDGQVEEGVRVALLKLVTDGSRPMGEMSDSWRENQKLYVEHTDLNFQGKHYKRKNIRTVI